MKPAARRTAVLALVTLTARCAMPETPVTAPPPAKPAAPTAPSNAAARLTAADIGDIPPLNAVYTSYVPLLEKSIPLPAGAWRVVQEQRSTFDGYPPGAEITLARAEHGQLTALLTIAGNAASHPASNGWPVNPVCLAADSMGNDTTLLAADARSREANGDQDCVTLSTAGPETLAPLDGSLAHLGATTPDQASMLSFGETDIRYRLTEQLFIAGALNTSPRPPKSAHTSRRLMAWAQKWRRVARDALENPQADIPAGVAQIP